MYVKIRTRNGSDKRQKGVPGTPFCLLQCCKINLLRCDVTCEVVWYHSAVTRHNAGVLVVVQHHADNRQSLIRSIRNGRCCAAQWRTGRGRWCSRNQRLSCPGEGHNHVAIRTLRSRRGTQGRCGVRRRCNRCRAVDKSLQRLDQRGGIG